ncbi:hypothetical protein BC940DRAFT_108282 [Gongronella butleri]|nr:hypothetical protein BC940DRAFT_108282 [Gongronella butleri]
MPVVQQLTMVIPTVMLLPRAWSLSLLAYVALKFPGLQILNVRSYRFWEQPSHYIMQHEHLTSFTTIKASLFARLSITTLLVHAPRATETWWPIWLPLNKHRACACGATRHFMSSRKKKKKPPLLPYAQ